MGKAKNHKLAEMIYVQRVKEEGGEYYLLATETLDGVDLDYGPIVGVYERTRVISVSEKRIVEGVA